MRIVSLVPSATETLFALGVGEQVAAVTHECDYPVEALDLPRVTHDVIGPGLEADEIDAAVRALTGQGKAIYELDGPGAARARAGPHRDPGAVRGLRRLGR
jgi:iron complex transport system substrate-binding protein